jgi:hypothetical protein
MLARLRPFVAGLTAALVLGLAVGAASAARFSLSNQNFRIVWRSLQFKGEGFVRIECPVTLEGSLHSRTFVKASGALIGYITRALLASSACTGGLAESASLGTETLPWHVKYESFTGTLPNITSLGLRVFDKVERVFEMRMSCLYMPAMEGMKLIATVGAGGVITRVDTDPPNLLLPRVHGGPICPIEYTDVGRATITVLNSTAAITITLI